MAERKLTTVEIWKPIPLTGGLYDASTRGRIRRSNSPAWADRRIRKTGVDGVLKPRVNPRNGYCQVVIYLNAREPKYLYIHALVTDAFYGCRPDGADVNHKDGDRGNNRPGNLEYVTRGQNHLHAYQQLGRKKLHPVNRAQIHASQKRAKLIRAMYAAGGKTQDQIAKHFGVSRPLICMVINGKRGKSYVTPERYPL